MTTRRAMQVYVSYAPEDGASADRLCAALDAARIPYWRERASPAELREAIRAGTLVFLACLGERSRTPELELALDEFRARPSGSTWLIPVRFADRDLPERDLGGGRTLRDLDRADLFGAGHPVAAITLVDTIRRLLRAPDAAAAPGTPRLLVGRFLGEPAHLRELDEVVLAEVSRILAAMRDEDRFPSFLRRRGTQAEHLVHYAETADSYWRLVEPLCSALQVAARWAGGPAVTPWTSALDALAREAARDAGGTAGLLELRHVPAFVAMFTAALSATGQGRWDNFRALIVDPVIPAEYGIVRRSLVQLENPTTPFRLVGRALPDLLATAAEHRIDPRAAQGLVGDGYYTPAAEWLHTILRPHFRDQFVQDDAYDDAFERTELMLGLVAQDLHDREAGVRTPNWTPRPVWLGRSVPRAAGPHDPLETLTIEIEFHGAAWAPLAGGLFGGDLQRARSAVRNYAEKLAEQTREFS